MDLSTGVITKHLSVIVLTFKDQTVECSYDFLKGEVIHATLRTSEGYSIIVQEDREILQQELNERFGYAN